MTVLEDKVSVIIPAYNEEENLMLLVEGISKVMNEYWPVYEIVIVNDGSTDGTRRVLKEITSKFEATKVFHHFVRKGKTAALATGLQNVGGSTIVFIDADLQYDPKDIPNLIDSIRNGYDVVNGWRFVRNDPITKKLPSGIFNFLAKRILGTEVNDYNSGLKAFRREVLENITFFGDQHRYILALAKHHGYRVGEVKIQHSARRYGVSKYGAKRLLYGIMDLITIKLRLTFLERPMVLFGVLGISMLISGVIGMIYHLTYQLIYEGGFHFRPLFLVFTILIVAGIQFFCFGFLADIILMLREELRRLMRTNNKSQNNL